MKLEVISEADNWLRGEFLELKPLINLARGAHPTRDWPPPNEWRAPFRNLKAAIDAGELLATLRASRADKSAVVKLTDLWAFLTKPERRNDTSWDWACAFCHRWADTRGESLPDPEKSRATTIGAENQCREWLEGLMNSRLQKRKKSEYQEQVPVHRLSLRQRKGTT